MLGYLFSLLSIAVYLLIVMFMVRLVLDWIQTFARYWRPRGAVLVASSFVYAVTDPPMNLARRYIRPLNLGGISLDLGFMVLLLALYFLYQVLLNLTVIFS
ncbi:YggT family protein [Rothia nasimurium]|uniref:YggT family protein n=1 Tax=Rothia nasimurium TaxID=85336 RepID=UPI003014509B